eukprot:m.66439 g.66439  ORF g.66439 m.66439 type:complete len:726 (-) comp18081_c0_seq2:100-2277(-)
MGKSCCCECAKVAPTREPPAAMAALGPPHAAAAAPPRVAAAADDRVANAKATSGRGNQKKRSAAGKKTVEQQGRNFIVRLHGGTKKSARIQITWADGWMARATPTSTIVARIQEAQRTATASAQKFQARRGAVEAVPKDPSVWHALLADGCYSAWAAAPPRLRDDREYTLELVSKYPAVFPYIPDEFKESGEMVMAVAKQSYTIYPMLEAYLRSSVHDRAAGAALPFGMMHPAGVLARQEHAEGVDGDTQLWMKRTSVPAEQWWMRRTSFELLLSKEAAIAAVTTSWWCFPFIDQTWKVDQDVIFAAMASHNYYLQAQLRDPVSNMTWSAMGNNFPSEWGLPLSVLEMLPEGLQEDPAVVLESIRTESGKWGTPITRASATAREVAIRKKSIVMAGCIHSPEFDVLRFVADLDPSSPFFDDEDVVLCALRCDWTSNSFQYAGPRLKADKKFVLDALRETTFRGVGRPRLCDDRRSFITMLPDILKRDNEVVFAATRHCSNELFFCDKTVRRNKELAMDVVAQRLVGSGFEALDAFPELCNDVDLWRQILALLPIEKDGHEVGEECCGWNTDTDQHKFRTIWNTTSTHILQRAPRAIRENEELALIAARRADSSLKHIIWNPKGRIFWNISRHSLMFRSGRDAVRVVLMCGIRHRRGDTVYQGDIVPGLPQELWLTVLECCMHPLGFVECCQRKKLKAKWGREVQLAGLPRRFSFLLRPTLRVYSV